MIDYKPALKEISAAKKCIEFMENSKNHDEYEGHWRDFLTHIDKSFNKLLCATKPVKGKFSSYFSKNMMLRKADEMLVYLLQARNSDFHSTQDIAQLSPAHTTFGAMPGVSSLFVKKMVINNGFLEHYEGDPLMVSFHPNTTRVVAVENQGQRYNPPSMHLGEHLSNNHPTTLAKLGVTFYENWINESSSQFK